MCCRYYIEMSPELRLIVQEMNRAPLTSRMIDKLGRGVTTEGEVRPADIVPVIAPAPSGTKKVFPMRWGFTARGIDRPIVNCRVETAAANPLWKGPWISHRCIVPASYYFEWEHLLSPSGKPKLGSKYIIQPRGSDVCYMAGLYRIEEYRGLKYPVFAILTRPPSQPLSHLHDRMPIVFPPEAIDAWIQPKVDPTTLLKSALTDLVLERSDEGSAD